MDGDGETLGGGRTGLFSVGSLIIANPKATL